MEIHTKPAQGSSELLSGRTIHIIGSCPFNNELLAGVIELQTKARCVSAKSFADLEAAAEDASSRELYLWDCLGKSLDGFMTEFVSGVEKFAESQFVVLFNVHAGSGLEESCVSQGIRGLFYEDDGIAIFLKGLAAVYRGELWFSREVMTRFILDDRHEETSLMKVRKILTMREIEIISLVAVGCKNEEIAEKLCVSPHTIKTHLYNVYKKINVNNRLQATLWAAKNL